MFFLSLAVLLPSWSEDLFSLYGLTSPDHVVKWLHKRISCNKMYALIGTTSYKTQIAISQGMMKGTAFEHTEFLSPFPLYGNYL